MGNLPIGLLDSGASNNFFYVNWCDQNGLEYKWGKWFSIQLADGQEVHSVGKLCCLIDLGLMIAALTFLCFWTAMYHVIYNSLFLQTVNPIMNWINCSVQVFTVSGFCLLEVVSSGLAPQCDILS